MRGASLPVRPGVRNTIRSGIAENDTATVAEGTPDCAHKRSRVGSAIRVTERMTTKPRARPRGHFSRFQKIAGSQSSAASRNRTAAPRKGGTDSAKVSAATHVVPQTMPSAPKASHCLAPIAALESIQHTAKNGHTAKEKGCAQHATPSLTQALKPVTAVRGLRHHRSHRLDPGHGCDAACAADLRDHLDHHLMPACEPLPLQDRAYHPRD